MDIPKLLTTKEFAGIFRVSVGTVSNWITSQTIPAEYVIRPAGSRQGCKILINEKAVELLMQPPPTESSGLKHYTSHKEESGSYRRLLSRF